MELPVWSVARKVQYPEAPFMEIEGLCVQLNALLVARSESSSFSPVSKLPCIGRDICQSGIRRSLELTGSFIRDFNSEAFIPLFVSSRAIFETAAVVAGVWLKVSEALTKGDKKTFEELDSFLRNTLLGSRTILLGDPEVHSAPNVLTAIERVDKKLSTTSREMYDALSEFCHPNHSGMLGPFFKPDFEGRASDYIDKPALHQNGMVTWVLQSLVGGLGLLWSAVDAYESVLLPDFVMRCELAIYESGSWPKALPYPRIAK